MGIDPGTNVMGYGVLGVNGKKTEVVVLGVIQLSKFESHYKRLHRIFERVSGLAEQYLPDEVALEAPFFGKNVQSMLKLGRAQGWLWLQCCRATYRWPNTPPNHKDGSHRQRPGLERTSGQYVETSAPYDRRPDAETS